MKTGTCKFGATCKYHHPKYEGAIMSSVPLNSYGYPLRPVWFLSFCSLFCCSVSCKWIEVTGLLLQGEKECSYYVKTGECRFGVTCKFHHPQSVNTPAAVPAPALYPPTQSPSVASQLYGGATSWQPARSTLLSGSYVQGGYGPVLLSPGMVPVQAWGPYPVNSWLLFFVH